MTTVNVSFKVWTPEGHKPVGGYGLWRATARRDLEGYIVVPDPFKVKVPGGTASMQPDPTVAGTWAWEIEWHIGRQVWTDFKAVPGSGTYDYDDLEDVDPDTLDPSVPMTPAWKAYVDQLVSDIIGGAPGALDTLNELAAALGDDANFAATVATQLGLKADQDDLLQEITDRSDADAGIRADLTADIAAAIAAEVAARNAAVAAAVAALVNSSPSTLDTLKELADALGDDPNFATTMATALGQRAQTAWLLLLAARNYEGIIVGTITRDGNNAITSAPVVWPDGTPGTFTTDTASALFPGEIDAYHITYGSPVTKTYTQPLVTRNASGAITAFPAIVVT